MKVRQFNICNEVYEILARAKSLIKEYDFKSITTAELICALLEEKNNLSRFLSENQIDLETRKKVSKEIMQVDKGEYEKLKGQVKETTGSEISDETQEEFEIAAVLINMKDKTEYPISEDLLNVLTFANSQDKNKEITSDDVIKALVSIDLQVLLDVFSLCKLDENKAVKDFFAYIKLIYYPSTLLQCLNDITAEVNPKSECLILERNQEVRDIYRGLLKTQSNNVVLVGLEGAGKSAVVEKLCWRIVTGNCPEELKDVKIVSLDIKSFIARLSFAKEDTVTNIFNDLETFLNFNKDIILYINSANVINDDDVKYGGLSSVINTIRAIIKKSGVRVIFEATYQVFQKKIQDTSEGFEVIEVKEFKAKDVPKILQRKIRALEEKHDVKINSKMIKNIHALCIAAYCNSAPLKEVLDTIDASMVEAKFVNKNHVTPSMVKEVFRMDFENYKKLSEEAKRATAFHEAGHFIASHFLKKLRKERKNLVVSIIPMAAVLGINVYEATDEWFTVNRDMEFFNEYIARDLAGRISEKKYTGVNSSGAMSDIKHATIIAKKIVDNYGLCNEFSKNRIYDYGMYSTNSVDKMNEEVDKIIKKAYNTAETILQEYEECLEKIVDALMKKGILDYEELEKICKPYEEE